MAFTNLPAELQIQIFGYLNRVDLKSIRGVCGVFRDNASPSLFERVLACARYQALGSFQKVSLHSIYQTYVKQIVYDGSVYDESFATSENRYHKQTDMYPELRDGLPWHKRARFKRYQELFREQEEMRKDGVLLQTIARALEWMPNVSSIVFSPGPRHIPLEAKLMRDLLPRNVVDVYAISRLDRFDSYIETSQHGFHHLIGAIYSANYSNIREFRVEAARKAPSNPGIEFTVFVFEFPNPLHMEAGKYFFRHLHKLQMNLSFLTPGSGTRISSGTNAIKQLSNLAIMIAQARDLRELSFHISRHSNLYKMYSYIIPPGHSIVPYLGLDLTWPNLRSLSFGGIYAVEKELVGLISRHKETLVEIEFTVCGLHSGTWANIVDEVLYNSGIDKFSLKQVNETMIDGRLFWGMSPDEMELWCYEGEMLVGPNGDRHFVGGSMLCYAIANSSRSIPPAAIRSMHNEI
ncbi:hypothetical protein K469DRAFT_658895, partial [Zopfia rhizophila CBS 207.26]